MPSKAKQKTGRRQFPGIQAIDFQHPADLQATAKLSRLPGMKRVFKKVSVAYFEKLFRMLNKAERVQVSPKQCPRVYEMFREACSVLDVPEVPEIYLATVYNTSAYSFGIEKYSVILTSGLIDLMDDDELFFVIGREVAHIKCSHMLYRSLIHILNFLESSVFHLATMTLLPIEIALRAWERKAEFTADRGGLLVVQDRGTAQNALVKLAGAATKSLLPKINMDEILKQADELSEMDEEILIRGMKMYKTAFRSSPFPIVRIKELHNWSHSTQYQRIISGNYGSGS